MPTSEKLRDYVEKGGFYKAVVEDGADIIFVVNYDGDILYHNPSVKDTLGHEPNSLTGHNFFDYILPETLSELQHKFNKCIKKPYAESIEFRFRKNDGSFSYLEFNSVNLKHKDGMNGLILDCRDINQRKKDAEELLTAQKTKEQFLANMSHEIRTPINGIAGMVTLLSDTYITPEQKKYLSAIKNSSDNLKVIINDILDFSVIESGKLKFEKIGFNINYQLLHIVDTFQFQAEEKGINLKLNINKSLDTVVLGDPVRLNQILINLISNAIKFTHKGGIEVSANPGDENDTGIVVNFSVIDTGIGIHSEKLETIFESFSQADESVTRRFGGTGLGLAISKQLVELQDGKISVTSEENKGTSFMFSINYAKGKSEDLVIHRGASLAINKENAAFIKNVNILLVEDNDINRLYAANILKKWGCEFDSAENGYIATEKLKKGSFDIVLMDVQMPVMDGVEATKLIRTNFPDSKKDIPIIALTANVIKGDDERYQQAGMSDYLPKPFLPEDLLSMILKHTHQIKLKKNIDLPTSTDRSDNKLVDLSFIIKMSDNDHAFIAEMIQLFIDQTPLSIKEMRDAIDDKDWTRLSNWAHKAKPSMTFVGLNAMKNLLSEIEMDKKHDVNALTLQVDELAKTCDNASHELMKIMSEMQ